MTANPRDGFAYTFLAQTVLFSGDYEGGEEITQRVLASAPRKRSRLHSHHAMHMVSAVYAILGDKAKAVALLKKAANTGFPHYSLFRSDRHFESLHTYGPFQRLMTAIKREGLGYQREFGTSAPL